MKKILDYLTETSTEDLERLFDRLNREAFAGKLVRDFPIVFREDKNRVAAVKPRRIGRNLSVAEMHFSKNYKFTPEQFQSIMLHEMIHVLELQHGIDSDHGRVFQQQLERLRGMGYKVNQTEKSSELDVAEFITGRESSYAVIRIVDPKQGDVFLLIKKFTPALESAIKDIINKHARVYGEQTIRIYRNVKSPVFDKMKFATSVSGAFARQYVLEPQHESALNGFDYEEITLDGK